MLDAMVEWMGYPMYYAYQGAEAPVRAGARHATIFPYGPFVVGDGRTVILGLQNEREWAGFCELVLNAPALVTDARFLSNSLRSQNQAALAEIITTAFAELSLETVVERLDRAGIANAAMNEMADVWQHKQLVARDRWREVDTTEGCIPALLPPGGIGSEPRMDPVPGLGEHSWALLAELGYSAEEIDALQKLAVI